MFYTMKKHLVVVQNADGTEAIISYDTEAQARAQASAWSISEPESKYFYAVCVDEYKAVSAATPVK
jgi:hypothetical protein